MRVNDDCISRYDGHHSHGSKTVLASDNHESIYDLNTFPDEVTILDFGLKVFFFVLASKYFLVFDDLRSQIFVAKREREREGKEEGEWK